MRWVVHWRIGEAALAGRRSLAFQLGCVLPDWFELHPIHRREESGQLFLNRALSVRAMAPGWRRDYRMGTLAHFACDYCTMAHNEEYYNFYRHRIYEVLAQKYLIRRCKTDPSWFVSEALPLPAELGPSADDAAFRTALWDAVNTRVEILHEAIAALRAPEWFREERVAELDIREGWRLVSLVTRALEAGEEGTR